MSNQWKERNKPARLERRYLFQDYSSLSDFLERAAELSERENLFPDMGFGKDYANITIHADEDTEKLADNHYRFAQELDKLFNVTDT
jgi:pterin-4a-carbinolamine dehydratase